MDSSVCTTCILRQKLCLRLSLKQVQGRAAIQLAIRLATSAPSVNLCSLVSETFSFKLSKEVRRIHNQENHNVSFSHKRDPTHGLHSKYVPVVPSRSCAENMAPDPDDSVDFFKRSCIVGIVDRSPPLLSSCDTGDPFTLSPVFQSSPEHGGFFTHSLKQPYMEIHFMSQGCHFKGS